MPGVFLPADQPISAGQGIVTPTWADFFRSIAANIASLLTTVASIPGVNNKTVATQPTLGAGDAGYLMWLTDYKHLLRWTGTVWEFFGDSSNAFFADFIIAPQTGLWQLCDGSTVNYLTLGATLTETAFTTPNLVGTPAYRKAAAAYTGTITAKGGSTATGTTGTGTTGTGTTGTGTTGTGTTGTDVTGSEILEGIPTVSNYAAPGSPQFTHHHSVPGLSVPGLSVPGLSVPGLSVPGLNVPALGVGSIEMANLGCLPYFRR